MRKIVIGIIIVLIVVASVTLLYKPYHPVRESFKSPPLHEERQNPEYTGCPVENIQDIDSCASYCVEHIGWDRCKEWCMENPGKCRVDMVEPPEGEPKYWKIYSVNFWEDDYIDDIKEISKMNGNMMMIFFSASPLPDGSLDVYRHESKEIMELTFAKGIATAHENGLHVIFDLEVGGPEALPAENRDAFLENYKEFITDWAKFCEKYKVYAFNLNSELDNEFFIPENCEGECKNKEVGRLAQELLKEVRKHYRGKVGVGVLDTWSGDYNLTGYDFFTTNLPCGDGDVEGCVDFYGEAISGANALKKKYNVPKFVIGEVDIFSENDATPEGMEAVQGFTIVSEQEEVEFYNNFFEKYADRVDGITITYSDPLGVKTGPARDVVSNWFKNL